MLRDSKMACSRGAASPDTHTQRRLFAASAGYCQNPGCSNELFIDASGKSIHIAEMAHVFAANDGGPRVKPSLDKDERGAFENLVVLCANCHTMVDKAPESFPDTMMMKWKREHSNKLHLECRELIVKGSETGLTARCSGAAAADFLSFVGRAAAR